MKYFILNPNKRDKFKTLTFGMKDLASAMNKHISLWKTFLDCGFDQHLSIHGNKRRRKKKMKRLLKDAFVEEFLDCMDEVDLTKEEAENIISNLEFL